MLTNLLIKSFFDCKKRAALPKQLTAL